MQFFPCGWTRYASYAMHASGKRSAETGNCVRMLCKGRFNMLRLVVLCATINWGCIKRSSLLFFIIFFGNRFFGNRILCPANVCVNFSINFNVRNEPFGHLISRAIRKKDSISNHSPSTALTPPLVSQHAPKIYLWKPKVSTIFRFGKMSRSPFKWFFNKYAVPARQHK